MDRPKGGTSMFLPPLYTIPLTLTSLTLQLDSNCLGFLFVFALKIGATYARLFLASRVESLFWIFFLYIFLLFFFLFFSFFVFCVHFVYFSRLVFCFFYAFAVLSLSLFFRDESCTRVVRQFELTLWGVRGVECRGGACCLRREGDGLRTVA